MKKGEPKEKDNNATENVDGNKQDGSCLKKNCRASSIQSSRQGERKRRRNKSLTEAPCQWKIVARQRGYHFDYCECSSEDRKKTKSKM